MKVKTDNLIVSTIFLIVGATLLAYGFELIIEAAVANLLVGQGPTGEGYFAVGVICLGFSGFVFFDGIQGFSSPTSPIPTTPTIIRTVELTPDEKEFAQTSSRFKGLTSKIETTMRDLESRLRHFNETIGNEIELPESMDKFEAWLSEEIRLIRNGVKEAIEAVEPKIKKALETFDSVRESVRESAKRKLEEDKRKTEQCKETLKLWDWRND